MSGKQRARTSSANRTKYAINAIVEMSSIRHDFFSRLFADSAEALRRYVRRLVPSRDTADEIVQEAFLRTYAQGQELETPRAFLFCTARNLAADIRRHERIAATDTVGDSDYSGAVSESEPIENWLIADEASRLLKEAVEQLPPQCRAVFALKVFHGHSYREIAAQLGLAEKTVEKHVARGLLRTHQFMRARYADEVRRERATGAIGQGEGE